MQPERFLPRKISQLFLALTLVCLSGCMASETQRGETFVYKKTILNSLFLLIIAVTLIVFGVGFIRESLKASKPKKRKRSRSGRRRPEKAPEKKTWPIVLGSGLTLGGVLVLVLGVPSSFVQHITVHPDKVEMRISVLWFSKGTREIPFSSINSLSKSEEEVASRKGTRTKETMHLHLASGTESIEMGPLEKAAFPKLKEMYDAYRASGGAVPDPDLVVDADLMAGAELINSEFLPKPESGDPVNNENVAQADPPQQPVQPGGGFNAKKPSSTPMGPGGRPGFQPTPTKPAAPVDPSKLTPVTHIGRFSKGSAVSVKGVGQLGYGRATILEVYSEGKLKVMPYEGKPGDEMIVDIADSSPAAVAMFAPENFGPGTPINPASPPTPGTTLLAFHGGRWFAVEFVAMDRSRATIQWPAERGSRKVPIRMVRIPPAEGAERYDGKRYHPPNDDGLMPISQGGVYAQGREHYLNDAGVTRKVVLLQLYREQIVKVQDAKTNEILYVHIHELSRK